MNERMNELAVMSIEIEVIVSFRPRKCVQFDLLRNYHFDCLGPYPLSVFGVTLPLVCLIS
jgi:hypothetical protein